MAKDRCANGQIRSVWLGSDRHSSIRPGHALLKIFPVSMSKVVAVILAMAVITFLVGNWIASGVQSGW